MSDYKPGSYFLAHITGPVGYGIALGQALAGSGSRWTHAGLILDTDGTILEAEPGGARIANISKYDGRPLLVSDGPVQRAVTDSAASYATMQRQAPTLAAFSAPFPEAVLRQRVVDQARKLVGVPYSGLDYVALAALHLHLPSKWIRDRVESSHHLICSALVDRALMNAGIHLFDDGRLPGDVMPADLAAWAEDWERQR
jgi:hypothetical protein